jgi:NADPH2:quinone reductase
VVNELGPPDVLRLEEVETPEPGQGEVLIEVAVAGVNFADVGMRAGMMGGPHALELAYTPGFEVAGVAAAVGEGAEGLEGGDREAVVLPAGGYAEYAVAPAEAVVRIPDGVGFADRRGETGVVGRRRVCGDRLGARSVP